jgi:hypothetical protein
VKALAEELLDVESVDADRLRAILVASVVVPTPVATTVATDRRRATRSGGSKPRRLRTHEEHEENEF